MASPSLSAPISPRILSPHTEAILSAVSAKLLALPPFRSPSPTPPFALNSRKRRPCSAPGSPPHGKHLRMDVNMNQNLDQLIVGPLVYNPPATGWTRPLIRANHNTEVIQFMDAHSPSCIAVVILASDFVNRESAPAAIKTIFQAHGIADVDMIDPLPAIPKVVDAVTNTLPFGMPWTHVVTGCTTAFRTAVLAQEIFHGSYLELPMTFYCMPVNPDPPFIVLVFTGIASLTPDTDIRDALLAKLTSDQTVLDMITTNHSNVPGDHTPAFILNTLFSIAQISTCTVRRRIPRGPTIPIPATRIIFPPFDRDPDVNENFRRHVLSTNFSFAVPLRGTGTPWLGPNPLAPKLIECTECHGSDHYKEDCPILNSDAYRNARGIAPVSANPVAAASSLSFTPAAPTPTHNSIGGAFRGGGRGFIRGGFGGYSRGRGRGGFGRANGHGYSPYYA